MRREFFGRPAAAMVIVRDGDKVLMVKRRGSWHPGKYMLPSGHVEQAESIRTAAQRELKEEVGLDAKQADLKFVHVCHRMPDPQEEDDREYLDFYFEAKTFSSEARNMEPDTHSDIAWISIHDLDNHPIVPYTKTALRAIDNSTPYDEFGW